MSCFVDVILPLPLSGSFTYRLAPSYEAEVQVGSRVVVQFGAKRYYARRTAHRDAHAAEAVALDSGLLYVFGRRCVQGGIALGTEDGE